MNTKKMINDMLVTSTGVHLLDSGFGDGRHWQQNQAHHPKNDPELTIGECGVIINIAHYLPKILMLNEVCEEFNTTFATMPDWDYAKAYGVSAEAGAWLEAQGFTIDRTWNTYNGEEAISQTLQGANLKHEAMGDGDYILLQIHQGADVRGGYTDAKLFKMRSAYDYLDPCPLMYGYDPETEKNYTSEDGGYSWTCEEDDTTLEDDDGLPAGFEVAIQGENYELTGVYGPEA